MSYERRIQERISPDIKARLSVSESVSPHTVGGTETVIANLSGGGAFLQTEQQLPLATKVGLAFSLSLADVRKLKILLSVDALRNVKEQHVLVEATGVVIRHEEHGVGIIFDSNYQFTPIKAP